MTDTSLILSVARILTAALAGTISVLGFRAYRASRRRSLLSMSAGAGLLSLGYFAEGVLVEIMGWSLASATVIESATTLFAVSLLVGSLYLRDATVVRSDRPPQGGDVHGS